MKLHRCHFSCWFQNVAFPVANISSCRASTQTVNPVSWWYCTSQSVHWAHTTTWRKPSTKHGPPNMIPQTIAVTEWCWNQWNYGGSTNIIIITPVSSQHVSFIFDPVSLSNVMLYWRHVTLQSSCLQAEPTMMCVYVALPGIASSCIQLKCCDVAVWPIQWPEIVTHYCTAHWRWQRTPTVTCLLQSIEVEMCSTVSDH